MKFRLGSVLVVALALSAGAVAQDASGAPQQQGNGGGRGMRGGGMMGRGVGGTVTVVAADHFQVKNEAGEIYTVNFSANTRILKQQPRPAGQSDDQQPGAGSTRGGGNGGRDGWGGGRGNPPVQIKASDIQVGDAIVANGEVDEAGKSVGAVMILQLDPETVKRMHELQANFGKTWLMGRVTAVNETKVTLQSNVDNAAHAFVADENTAFRKRRDPITLADVQVGDMVRVEGAIKGGTFVATSVAVMGGGPGGGQNGGQRSQQPQ